MLRVGRQMAPPVWHFIDADESTEGPGRLARGRRRRRGRRRGCPAHSTTLTHKRARAHIYAGTMMGRWCEGDSASCIGGTEGWARGCVSLRRATLVYGCRGDVRRRRGRQRVAATVVVVATRTRRACVCVQRLRKCVCVYVCARARAPSPIIPCAVRDACVRVNAVCIPVCAEALVCVRILARARARVCEECDARDNPTAETTTTVRARSVLVVPRRWNTGQK